MRYLRVQNVTRGVELAQKVRVASTLVDRAFGLLSVKTLAAGEGLWLIPCKSIHTFFMRFPIDALFIDEQGTVLAQNTYTPWKMSGWHSKTLGVLELSAGTVERTATQVGDHLEMRDLPADRQGLS